MHPKTAIPCKIMHSEDRKNCKVADFVQFRKCIFNDFVQFREISCRKICIYQKEVVPLQPDFRLRKCGHTYFIRFKKCSNT